MTNIHIIYNMEEPPHLMLAWRVVALSRIFQLVRARRKLFFSESVIQSARANTDIKGLFYQNDIESLHAKQKRNQNFKTETVTTAISNIQNIIQRRIKNTIGEY